MEFEYVISKKLQLKMKAEVCYIVFLYGKLLQSYYFL